MQRTKYLVVDEKVTHSLGFDAWVTSAVNTIQVPLNDNAPWLQSQLREIQFQIVEFEIQRDQAKIYEVFNAEKAVADPLFMLRQQEKQFQMALKGYPAVMDKTFLSWRQKGTDWPVFMILGLNSPFVTITSAGNALKYTRSHDPVIPEFLMEQYDRTYRYLAFNFMSYSDHESFIRSEFIGLPGPETLFRIDRALTATDTSGLPLFDEVVIAAEAGEWKRGGTVATTLDPFVLGIVESTHQLYVIDVFNPSKTEQSVLNSHLSSLT